MPDKITVTRRGTNILLNGKKTQLRMATSFGWLGYIWNGKVRKAEKWLIRMKDIGMHGIRVFGEYADWEDNIFFGAHNIPPLYNVWNWSARHGSAVQVTDKHDEVLRTAIELLQKHGMIMEYVVSATAKAMPLVPGFQDHMCRAVAQWFNAYGGPTNTYFEISNEYDVTRQDELTTREIHDIGRRWRVARPENPGGQPDYPGSLLSISEGGEEGAGKWEIEYPTGTLSHINIHTPRGRDWKNVGPDIQRFLNKYKKPVILNENNHYMEPEQWAEWIPQIPNWAGISTKDAKGIIEQAKNAYAAGAAGYTLHWMTGMLTNPDLPLTKVEKLWKAEFGAEAPPPPDPEPEPEPEGKSFWQKILDFLVSILVPKQDEPELEIPPVKVERFRVHPNEIERGQTAELIYSTSGADSVVISGLGAVGPKGVISVSPAETIVYRIHATGPGGTDERRRKLTVFQPAPPVVYMESWDTLGDKPFRRATELHLGNAPYDHALKALDDILIWDGIRNPQQGLQCPLLEEYEGYNRQDITQIIDESAEALKLLRHYIKYRVERGKAVAYDGTLFEGRARKVNFERDIEIIIDAAIRAAGLDGIKDRAKELCG